MLAAFIKGKESVEVREVEGPSPAAGEVLLRVRACGICGSDLHLYNGEFPALPNISPGHEFAGDIVQTGEGVSGWEVGQRVAVEPVRCCRECAYCRTGRYNLCPQALQSMVGIFTPGGLAEYVAMPAYALHALPDELDFELGALAEPLGIAVHGVQTVDVAMGERVLVLGSGTIGLMSIIAAKAAGAGEVVATYRYEHQGKAALAVGATSVVPADDIPVPTMGALPVGGSYEVVIETVGGSAPTLGQALGAVRSGGRVSVLGVFSKPAEVNALAVSLKEIRIVGGYGYGRRDGQSEYGLALRILRSDPERARAVITHRFPLKDAGEAFATAADKGTKSLKVQVVP